MCRWISHSFPTFNTTWNINRQLALPAEVRSTGLSLFKWHLKRYNIVIVCVLDGAEEGITPRWTTAHNAIPFHMQICRKEAFKPLAQNREQIEPWLAMHSLSIIQNVTISGIFRNWDDLCFVSGEKMETFHSDSLARCIKRTLDPLNAHENVYGDCSDTLRNSHTAPETDTGTTPLP